ILNVVLLLLSVATANAQSAFVRVNQVGYSAHASKRAYVMSVDAETGGSFAVRNSHGETVFSAPITATEDQGAWGSFAHVYALDFDRVSRPGSYTIVVTGPDPAASLGFRIDHPARLFAAPLQNALFFYRNQRDGRHFIPTPLRSAPAHLHDRQA